MPHSSGAKSFPAICTRYMPRFAVRIFAPSLGSVATCGSVRNGPPSSGQPTICGRSASVHSSKSRILPEHLGSERMPAFAARNNVAGPACLKNSAGFDLNRTAVLVLSSVLRNKKSMRSRVPKMLHAARNLLPFTFSKSSAGPLLSNACRAISAISRYGSTSSRIRLSMPAFSRSSSACSSEEYMAEPPVRA